MQGRAVMCIGLLAARGRGWRNLYRISLVKRQKGLGDGLTDGTRTFRLQFKPKDGVWKATFQEKTFIPGRAKGSRSRMSA